MDREILESDSLYTNINAVENFTKSSIRVASFCIITSVDTKNRTLNAKPVINEKKLVAKDKYEYISLPELVNVPYSANILDTPKVGEFCVCIHLDRSVKGYTEEELKNNIGRSDEIENHKLSDCVAITGFKI